MKNFAINSNVSSSGRSSNIDTELKIMIVHNDWDTIHNIYFNIEISRPFNLITENRGDIAWERIMEHPPHFLITDIFLYGMGGIKLCEKLKDLSEFQDIFVLGLIDQSEKKFTKRLYDVGFDLILTKPLKGNILNSLIEYHTSQSQLNRLVFDSPYPSPL